MSLASLKRRLHRLEQPQRAGQGRVPCAGRVWRPLVGPQQMAYDCSADELFYGGAAGGGKSDLLLGLAATQHRKSLILRREATQLHELIPRSHEILAGRGVFSSSSKTWRNLAGGRSIEFGGCPHEEDKQRFKGRGHDLKAFDELPDFTESQYLFINAWNRTTIPGQRCRVVAAGNPPTTAEGEWILCRWGPWLDPQHPRPARPGELRWYARIDNEEVERADGQPFVWKGETIQPKSRTFIPARLADNPHLLHTGYGATLDALPEPLRSMLKHGDFTVKRGDDPWQIIPTAWIRLAQARWQALPPARTPLTCLGVDVARGGDDQTVLARRYGNWFAPLEKHPGRQTPDGSSVAALVQKALLYEREASVHIDVIGYGASAYDQCRQADLTVQAINFAEASEATDRSGKLRFANLRAAAYWALREALDPTLGDGLALPPDPELLADLAAGRWELTPRGVKMESKEDIRKRIGRSPDCADAVVYAHLPPPPPFKISLPQGADRTMVEQAPPGLFVTDGLPNW